MLAGPEVFAAHIPQHVSGGRDGFGLHGGHIVKLDTLDLPPSDGAKDKLGIADLKEGYDAAEKAFG